MTTTLKPGESHTLEIQHSKQRIGLKSKLVGLALLIKKYFPGISKSLNKVIGKQILLLEKGEMLADATSFQRTAIILSALRIGLFDYLNNKPGATANRIASDLNLNFISTERLLTALENINYLISVEENQDYCYYNSQLTSNYMVQESQHYLGNYYNIIDRTWSSWQSLDATIKTGLPNEKMDLFQGERETLYEYYVFSNEYLKEPARELFKQLPLESVNRMIAGEVGITFIGEILRRKPDIEFVVAGLEDQIDFLERLLKKYSLPKPPQEIVSSAKGNALTDKWGRKEEYDLIFLFRKLAYSDYGMQFLTKSFRVLRPGGMVIVLEPTTDSSVPSPSFLGELQMMDLLMGGVKAPPLYSTAQIVNLLKEVGFSKTEVLSTHNGSFSFVLGWKK
ncbi:MAG: methyltransferase dimerization domain-containing protein [Cyanobacteriota bacterium]